MITPSTQLETLSQKPIRKPTAKVYIMWDGVNWTDESDRLKSVTGFEEMGGGLFEMGMSEIDVVLYNDDFHFTLDHANCSIDRAEMIPKRRIKVEIGFNYNHLTRFQGYIESYVPDIKSGDFRIHAFDRSYTLQAKKSGYVFFEDYTPTELIQWLGELAGLTTSDMELDTTTNVIKFAYFEDRTVWFLMSQIAQAEGGRIFFNEENKLVFWNRSHISFASTPVFTFKHDDYILDQPYEISDKDIKNRILVNAEARQVYEQQVIWDVDDEFTDEFKRVNAHNGDDSNNLIFEVTLPNPVTSFVRPLVANTHYVANSAPDGSGSDLTSDIEIVNLGTFIRGLYFEIKYNSPTGIAYLTKLQVEGTPAKVYYRETAEVNNEFSQGQFGVITKEITNPYIDNYEFAVSLAQIQLNMFANTLSNFQTSVIAIPWIQPGDIVSVQVTPESSETETYLVTKARWTWQPQGGATMDLTLAINYAEYNKVSESLAFTNEEHTFTIDSGVYNWGPDPDDLNWNLGVWM